MQIRFADGSYVEGVIQRLEGFSMRVAIPGVDDAVEFVLVDRDWLSESGAVVTFHFGLTLYPEMLRVVTGMNQAEGHCAAGGDCMLRRMRNTGAGPAN